MIRRMAVAAVATTALAMMAVPAHAASLYGWHGPYTQTGGCVTTVETAYGWTPDAQSVPRFPTILFRVTAPNDCRWTLTTIDDTGAGVLSAVTTSGSHTLKLTGFPTDGTPYAILGGLSSDGYGYDCGPLVYTHRQYAG